MIDRSTWENGRCRRIISIGAALLIEVHNNETGLFSIYLGNIHWNSEPREAKVKTNRHFKFVNKQVPWDIVLLTNFPSVKMIPKVPFVRTIAWGHTFGIKIKILKRRAPWPWPRALLLFYSGYNCRLNRILPLNILISRSDVNITINITIHLFRICATGSWDTTCLKLSTPNGVFCRYMSRKALSISKNKIKCYPSHSKVSLSKVLQHFWKNTFWKQIHPNNIRYQDFLNLAIDQGRLKMNSESTAQDGDKLKTACTKENYWWQKMCMISVITFKYAHRPWIPQVLLL